MDKQHKIYSKLVSTVLILVIYNRVGVQCSLLEEGFTSTANKFQCNSDENSQCNIKQGSPIDFGCLINCSIITSQPNKGFCLPDTSEECYQLTISGTSCTLRPFEDCSLSKKGVQAHENCQYSLLPLKNIFTCDEQCLDMFVNDMKCSVFTDSDITPKQSTFSLPQLTSNQLNKDARGSANSPNGKDSEDTPSSTSAAIYVFSAIGVAFFIGISILVVCKQRKKRQRKDNPSTGIGDIAAFGAYKVYDVGEINADAVKDGPSFLTKLPDLIENNGGWFSISTTKEVKNLHSSKDDDNAVFKTASKINSSQAFFEYPSWAGAQNSSKPSSPTSQSLKTKFKPNIFIDVNLAPLSPVAPIIHSPYARSLTPLGASTTDGPELTILEIAKMKKGQSPIISEKSNKSPSIDNAISPIAATGVLPSPISPRNNYIGELDERPVSLLQSNFSIKALPIVASPALLSASSFEKVNLSLPNLGLPILNDEMNQPPKANDRIKSKSHQNLKIITSLPNKEARSLGEQVMMERVNKKMNKDSVTASMPRPMTHVFERGMSFRNDPISRSALTFKASSEINLSINSPLSSSTGSLPNLLYNAPARSMSPSNLNLKIVIQGKNTVKGNESNDSSNTTVKKELEFTDWKNRHPSVIDSSGRLPFQSAKSKKPKKVKTPESSNNNASAGKALNKGFNASSSNISFKAKGNTFSASSLEGNQEYYQSPQSTFFTPLVPNFLTGLPSAEGPVSNTSELPINISTTSNPQPFSPSKQTVTELSQNIHLSPRSPQKYLSPTVGHPSSAKVRSNDDIQSYSSTSKPPPPILKMMNAPHSPIHSSKLSPLVSSPRLKAPVVQGNFSTKQPTLIQSPVTPNESVISSNLLSSSDILFIQR